MIELCDCGRFVTDYLDLWLANDRSISKWPWSLQSPATAIALVSQLPVSIYFCDCAYFSEASDRFRTHSSLCAVTFTIALVIGFHLLLIIISDSIGAIFWCIWQHLKHRPLCAVTFQSPSVFSLLVCRPAAWDQLTDQSRSLQTKRINRILPPFCLTCFRVFRCSAETCHGVHRILLPTSRISSCCIFHWFPSNCIKRFDIGCVLDHRCMLRACLWHATSCQLTCASVLGSPIECRT